MINYLFEGSSEYKEYSHSYIVPADGVRGAIDKLVNYMVEYEDVDKDGAIENINTYLTITPHMNTTIIKI